MADPTTDEKSDYLETPVSDIAYYADNAEYYRKIKRLETLSRPQAQLCDQLGNALLHIKHAKLRSKIREAKSKECLKLMHEVDHIGTLHGRYSKLRKMIDEYRALTRGLKRKNLTRERYAELQNALTNLEEQFKGIGQVTSGIFAFNSVAYLRETIRQVRIFIREHTDQRSTQSDDEGTRGLGSGKAAALESNTAGVTRGHPNDLYRNAPRSDEGNETMRELLNDGFLLETLGEAQAIAKNIEALLNDPVISDINFYAVGSGLDPYDATILNIQRDYDLYYDELKDLVKAWDIYERYAYNNDMLREMDLKSTQAFELLGEQRQLEVAFEEYGTLVDAKSLTTDSWDLLNMLHNLKWLKGKINRTQDGDTEPDYTTGASQRSEDMTSETISDDNASSPDPAIQDEATPTAEPNQSKEPKPTDVKEPTPSPVATDLQMIAVGDVTDELCGPQETGNFSKTMRNTKRDSDKSGFVAIGAMVVQIMVAASIMAAL
ncbi:hypothetical protein BBBOND_0202570 [Babesia bigemina]|uniref:Uncharacterized protein n=1 Tax=Babesia bigemina TaxID=5866 RepID=A0A061DBH5_BABBI|nr:hypothetical protein BBBOND_0202570 [Babesia bigemina]CDR95100.1 hypothetical protein BBBOND_0202570 [Babesia bigemina]|eukprot:XP_012767286.1 hypothetical protein BBBOND_0202570 [Babesia bigemina]